MKRIRIASLTLVVALALGIVSITAPVEAKSFGGGMGFGSYPLPIPGTPGAIMPNPMNMSEHSAQPGQSPWGGPDTTQILIVVAITGAFLAWGTTALALRRRDANKPNKAAG